MVSRCPTAAAAAVGKGLRFHVQMIILRCFCLVLLCDHTAAAAPAAGAYCMYFTAVQQSTAVVEELGVAWFLDGDSTGVQHASFVLCGLLLP